MATTLAITVNGNAVSFRAGTLVIDWEDTSLGTASFTLDTDKIPAVSPAIPNVGQKVTIYDTGVAIWSGTVDHVRKQMIQHDQLGGIQGWEVSCVSLEQILSRRLMPPTSFNAVRVLVELVVDAPGDFVVVDEPHEFQVGFLVMLSLENPEDGDVLPAPFDEATVYQIVSTNGTDALRLGLAGTTSAIDITDAGQGRFLMHWTCGAAVQSLIELTFSEHLEQGMIEAGARLDNVIYSGEDRQYVWDVISDLRDRSGFMAYINPDYELNFHERTLVQAPNDIVDGGGIPLYPTLSFTNTREDYYNSAVARVPDSLAVPIIKTFQSGDLVSIDGFSRFFLDSKPLEVVAILFNGVPAKMAIKDSDTAADSAWYWRPGSKGIWQNPLDPAFTTGDELEVTYKPLGGYVVESTNGTEQSDRATIEDTSGKYEKYLGLFEESATMVDAQNKIDVLRDTYDSILIRGEFSTLQRGFFPGSIMLIDRALFGTGFFVIADMSARDQDGLYLIYSGRLTDSTRYRSKWDIWREMAKKGNGSTTSNVSVGENEDGIISYAGMALLLPPDDGGEDGGGGPAQVGHTILTFTVASAMVASNFDAGNPRIAGSVPFTLMPSAAMVFSGVPTGGGSFHSVTPSMSKAAIQAVLDSLSAGDTFEFSPGTYTGQWILTPNGQTPSSAVITIRGRGTVNLLTDNTNAAGVLDVQGHNYTLQDMNMGVKPGVFTNTVLNVGSGTANTISAQPQNVVLQRLNISGEPNLGARRGIYFNAGAGGVIQDCNITGIRANTEAQGILSTNGIGGWIIRRNYISAAGQGIFFGGSPGFIVGHVISDVLIEDNEITKDLAWRSEPSKWTAKNLLELKRGKNITIRANKIYNSWPGAQEGGGIVLTCRLEASRNPWNYLENIIVEDNVIYNVGVAINTLGRDYNSGYGGHFIGLTIDNNLIIPDSNYGPGRAIHLLTGVEDVTITRNTIVARTGKSIVAMLLDSTPTNQAPTSPGFVATYPIVNLDVQTNIMQGAVMSRGTTAGNQPLKIFAPGYTVEDNKWIGSFGAPSNNTVVTAAAAVNPTTYASLIGGYGATVNINSY